MRVGSKKNFIGGSIAVDQVAVGSSPNKIGGSSNLTVVGSDLVIASKKASRQSSLKQEVFYLINYGVPSGGAYALPAVIEFNIRENVADVVDRFDLPTNGLTNFRADVFNAFALLYAGSDSLFKGSSVGLLNFFSLVVQDKNDTATLFDLTLGAAVLAQIAFIESAGIGFNSLGVINELRPIIVDAAFVNCGGLTFNNNDDTRINSLIYDNRPVDRGTTFFHV